MKLVLLAGSANVALAELVAKRLDVELSERTIESFPDGEKQIELQGDIRGADVYILQPTGPPVADNLLELLLLADACWRAGAGRMTALISYYGYARQDRRARGREPIGARLVADLLTVARIDKIVALDLHDPVLEGFPDIPVEHLSAMPLLAEAAHPLLPENSVIVGPDLGATKLAERLATMLKLPVGIVHKARISGESVRVHRVIGDIEGKAPVIVDDMISTGGTVVAAAEALYEAGCEGPLTIVTTHALLVGEARERLSKLPLQSLLATDSLAHVAKDDALPLRIVSVAPLLAEAILRLYRDESLDERMMYR